MWGLQEKKFAQKTLHTEELWPLKGHQVHVFRPFTFLPLSSLLRFQFWLVIAQNVQNKIAFNLICHMTWYNQCNKTNWCKAVEKATFSASFLTKIEFSINNQTSELMMHEFKNWPYYLAFRCYNFLFSRPNTLFYTNFSQSTPPL